MPSVPAAVQLPATPAPPTALAPPIMPANHQLTPARMPLAPMAASPALAQVNNAAAPMAAHMVNVNPSPANGFNVSPQQAPVYNLNQQPQPMNVQGAMLQPLQAQGAALQPGYQAGYQAAQQMYRPPMAPRRNMQLCTRDNCPFGDNCDRVHVSAGESFYQSQNLFHNFYIPPISYGYNLSHMHNTCPDISLSHTANTNSQYLLSSPNYHVSRGMVKSSVGSRSETTPTRLPTGPPEQKSESSQQPRSRALVAQSHQKVIELIENYALTYDVPSLNLSLNLNKNLKPPLLSNIVAHQHSSSMSTNSPPSVPNIVISNKPEQKPSPSANPQKFELNSISTKSNKDRYVSQNLRMYHCNVRSIQNKKVTIENILMNANIDIGILSEINTKNVPHIKGYTQYTLYSPQRFHGLTICVNQQIKNSVMEIPHEKIEGIELIHLRYNDSLVPINIVGCYFDVECRSNNDSLQKSWLKFKSIIDCILATGEGLTLLGDCNRPLFSDKNTLGVKLMNEWLNEESCVLLNDKTYTRIDPASGAGSVLDLGIISRNILSTVKSFTVDSDKNWTPFSILKKGDDLEKKFTDHRAIILELKLQVLIKNSVDKRPFINTNDKSKWANFSAISDKNAEEMMEIITENDDVNIINIKLGILNFLMLIECFGISWKKESSKKKKIKKDYKELQELFELQFTELNEMIDEGSSSSSLMNKIYDVKKKINGPKIKTQGPRAINDPTTGDLITEVDEIKRVSLNHNIKILTKNKPRECDMED